MDPTKTDAKLYGGNGDVVSVSQRPLRYTRASELSVEVVASERTAEKQDGIDRYSCP